jgi:hypothetical protein
MADAPPLARIVAALSLRQRLFSQRPDIAVTARLALLARIAEALSARRHKQNSPPLH